MHEASSVKCLGYRIERLGLRRSGPQDTSILALPRPGQTFLNNIASLGI